MDSPEGSAAEAGVTDGEEAGRWRERALAAERWRDEAWAPLQERSAQAERAADLAERLQQIESSLSWRATAPLRVGAALARRVRKRLRQR
jgi:hypothetical protein